MPAAHAMEHYRHFAACPRCGARQGRPNDRVPFCCEACGFELFFNAAAAVAAFVRREDGAVLFVRRAKDPARGQRGLPGGFVDLGESAEEAVRREVREEVGLELGALTYVSSHANRYLYAGVTYHTLDLFYLAPPLDDRPAQALDAVDSVEWLDPMSVDLSSIAFESMRQALLVLRRRRG